MVVAAAEEVKIHQDHRQATENFNNIWDTPGELGRLSLLSPEYLLSVK